MKRARIDYPARLAEARAKLARAEYLRREAIEALLMDLERQIIGTVMCWGRDALRIVMRQTDDLFSWDGYRFYQACLFVATRTGRRPPGRYTSPWSTSELHAIAEHTDCGLECWLGYLKFSVRLWALEVIVQDFCLWWRHL